jgi:metal-responsive CopG/Arc/MetJ family transcriptional regulator
MKRTNIYLTESQAAALDEVAHAEGTSRAEVIRELIDRSLAGGRTAELEADLAAIYGSFGVLADESPLPSRGPDARSEYLDRLAGA